MKKTKMITYTGVFIAIGILFPYITGHAFSISGKVLLPMHIPVFLIGFLCGPVYGAIGGIIIPVLSSILTGMPPIYPMLPIMASELFVYGILSGYLYRIKKQPIYLTLILSMVAGRVVHGTVFAGLLLIHNKNVTYSMIMADVITGIPGTIIQLIIVPILVVSIKNMFFEEGESSMKVEDTLIQKACEMIKTGQYNCILIKDGEIIAKRAGNGVTPIIQLYDQEPELLENAIVVDKIIGKAAAILLVLAKAKAAHGILLSKSADEYLQAHNMEVTCGRCIDVVSNRAKDGICPLEKSVMEIDDPAEAYTILKETIARLRKIG